MEDPAQRCARLVPVHASPIDVTRGIRQSSAVKAACFVGCGNRAATQGLALPTGGASPR